MKIRTLKRRARPAAAVLIILFIAGAIATLAIPAPGNNRPTEQPTLTPGELEALDENLVRGYSEETVSPDKAMNVAVDFLAMTAIQKVLQERTREPWTESHFIEAPLAPPPRECARRSLTPDSTARTVSERMLNCVRQDLNHRNQAANWPGFTSIQKEAEARRALWNPWESVNPATRFRAAIIIVQGADPASDPAFLEFSAELEQEACLENRQLRPGAGRIEPAVPQTSSRLAGSDRGNRQLPGRGHQRKISPQSAGRGRGGRTTAMTCLSERAPGYYQTHSYTLTNKSYDLFTRREKVSYHTVMWRSMPEARRVPEERIARAVHAFLKKKRQREQEGRQPIDHTYWGVITQMPTSDGTGLINIKLICHPWRKHPTVQQEQNQTGEPGAEKASLSA